MFEFIEKFWQDFFDVLMWVPRKLFELLMVGLAELVNAIPVPDWVNDASGLFSGLPAGVAWGFYIFNFAFGLGVIISAYVLRFIIRRLPFVG